MTNRPKELSSGLEDELARKGVLPARKVGKGWRFYKPDLVAWVRGKEAPREEDR